MPVPVPQYLYLSTCTSVPVPQYLYLSPYASLKKGSLDHAIKII